MIDRFWKHRGLRRVVGFVVGQLFALQLLLAGVIATQMQVADNGLTSEICASLDFHPNDDAGGKARLKNAGCAICALASFSAPPLQLLSVSLARSVRDIARNDVVGALIDAADRFEPRSSQGPPQHA